MKDRTLPSGIKGFDEYCQFERRYFYPSDKSKYRRLVANRREINAYLEAIQKRINKGNMVGAKHLLQRLFTKNNLVYWECIVISDRLDPKRSPKIV